MKRMVSMLGMALACSVALGAQSTTDKVERKEQAKADRKGEVVVTGCVADEDSHGRYLLSNAMVAMPTGGVAGTTGTPDMPAMPATTTADANTSYELSGDDIKPQVGHKVEVTGKVDAHRTSKLAKKERKGETAPMDEAPLQVLRVRSIRMIASSCQ